MRPRLSFSFKKVYTAALSCEGQHLTLRKKKAAASSDLLQQSLLQIAMADLAGVITGGVALAALFTTCIDCFEYVQLGRDYGKNYQRSQLQLATVQVRLSRWGESVRIMDDRSLQKFEVPLASPGEAVLVQGILGEIIVVFEDMERVSRRMDSQQGSRQSKPVSPAIVDDKSLVSLAERMRSLAIQRQKNTSLSQKVKWALHGEKHLQRLLDDVQGFVQSLEDLFPAARSTQQQICAQDLATLTAGTREKPTLDILKNISTEVDPTLCQVAAERLATMPGHKYYNMRTSDRARMQNGNEFPAEYRGTIVSSHTFSGAVADGDSMVLNGDRVIGAGGQSFLSR